MMKDSSTNLCVCMYMCVEAIQVNIYTHESVCIHTGYYVLLSIMCLPDNINCGLD